MAKKPDRDALCRELLTIEKKHEKDFARMGEIKSMLKVDAGGDNFKIVISGLGEVSVSAPRDKYLEAVKPEIAVEAFLELPKGERSSLIKRGLVIEAEQWKEAYYGSVRTKLYP
jgi:hypothetical protein